MLRIVPVPEHKATGQIKELYASIKAATGADSVPLVFQYLAVFPDYVHFLWEQISPNLTDPAFQSQTRDIIRFGQTAISGVYSPSPIMELLQQRINNRPEHEQLMRMTQQLQGMNASLYFLSLAIRESLKGKYLGIKQIGAHLSPEEKRTFYSVTDTAVQWSVAGSGAQHSQHSSGLSLRASQSTALAPSLYQKFFHTIEQEMESLMKKESYLTRRVELERFSLAKLQFLPYPLDSSFITMTRKSGEHPQFPELVYLLSDIFPTQTPYKLLTSLVMKHALSHLPADPTENAKTRSTAVSLEKVRD